MVFRLNHRLEVIFYRLALLNQIGITSSLIPLHEGDISVSFETCPPLAGVRGWLLISFFSIQSSNEGYLYRLALLNQIGITSPLIHLHEGDMTCSYESKRSVPNRRHC